MARETSFRQAFKGIMPRREAAMLNKGIRQDRRKYRQMQAEEKVRNAGRH